MPVEALRPFFLGASAGLFALSGLVLVLRIASRLKRRSLPGGLKARMENASVISFLTDDQGRLLGGNTHARAFGLTDVGITVARALAQVSIDPEVAVDQLMRTVLDEGVAETRFGLTDHGARLHVTLAERGYFLWTLIDGGLDEDLAILTVTPDGCQLNAAAGVLLGEAPRPLGEIVQDLPLRRAGRHTLQTASGETVLARLVELQSFGDVIEYAVVPEPDAPLAALLPSQAFQADADLLSSLPVPMLKIRADGTLLEVNAEARSILSLKEGALPPLFELVEGMGRPIADWIADAAAGRGLLKPEIVRAVIPGQELYLQITLGQMVEAGEVVLVAILNDATELKTLEAQFVQSQKMQAIGQLAGGVAHDFNNLLTAISGHCDLLLLRHDAGDPDYADLIQISQNANRAASLVGQLLAFSRKQNLKPQALDLRDTMVDLVHLLNRLIGERIQLEVTHAPGPQIIRADRRQLEQVIVNLVVNARDAMPDGGKIIVETRTEYLEDEVSRDRARLTPGDYVVIEVTDSGTGIPPEAMAKIFEPFFTTKKTGEGTGLGLSTAYGIVKQTGGYIFVKSELGEGTTFSLYFPASETVEAPEVESEVPSATVSTSRVDGAILLVEDEAPVRAFACRALRLRGYNVIEASNAEEALEILEDKALQIDLFVTDVIMPGMDGPTWVRRALKDRPDTSVVFMSGYAEEGRAEKQARIPNSDFLPKPFSLQQLTALVQEKLQ
ncbi:MAG: ATP-binding protein [Paracoccaceae bacterium]|nr:ATP-binding protein [Paracoccaceae bacterium]